MMLVGFRRHNIRLLWINSKRFLVITSTCEVKLSPTEMLLAALLLLTNLIWLACLWMTQKVPARLLAVIESQNLLMRSQDPLTFQQLKAVTTPSLNSKAPVAATLDDYSEWVRSSGTVPYGEEDLDGSSALDDAGFGDLLLPNGAGNASRLTENRGS